MTTERALDRSIAITHYRLEAPPEGGALFPIRHIPAVAALALALGSAPVTARAKPIGIFSRIVQAPGDQTDPSIDRGYVVFSSNGSGSWDVLRYDLDAPIGTDPVAVIAGGTGDQDQPDLFRTAFVYREGGGVFVRNWTWRDPIRTPGAPQAACGAGAVESHPRIAAEVAAWECELAGSQDVAVFRYGDTLEEYRIPRSDAPGVDRGWLQPAAFLSFVGYVDGADGGSVWLHDSTPGQRRTVKVCEGRATGVALGSVEPLETRLAVTRASGGHDVDVEVWNTRNWDAMVLVTTLRVGGEQRNPHIAADWVAFEDLSTGPSQVVLWQWTTGLVFLPSPSTSNQTLNDVATIPGTEVRAVFADDGDGTGTNRDIALYQLVLDGGQVVDDGTGNPWPWTPPPPPPASCDDPDAIVLARIDAERGQGKPRAASAAFDAPPFPGEPVLPVLVCIDAGGVSAAWVTLDDQAIAMPDAFDPSVRRLEIPALTEGGAGRLALVVAGKPGSTLVVRVLADPGRPPDCAAAPSDPRCTQRAPIPHAALAMGCGTGGGAGSLASLALLAALGVRRRR